MRLSGLRSAIKAHWRSGAALFFAILHVIIFLVIIFSETPLPPWSDEPCPPVGPGEACIDLWEFGTGIIVAGRYFHTELGFTLLGWADLPAMVVAGVVLTPPLYPAGIEFSPDMESYLFAWVWLLFGTLQWWLCGIWLTARRTRRAA
jgi:hypothetical protein